MDPKRMVQVLVDWRAQPIPSSIALQPTGRGRLRPLRPSLAAYLRVERPTAPDSLLGTPMRTNSPPGTGPLLSPRPAGACASGPGGERPRAGSASPRADAGGGASAASGGKMNYMPGTASLIQDIDKKHLVLLRDGRTLIGYLRSIDQFANLVLHQTVERIHVGKKYGDIPRGIFVVRGENVVLLGEIDLEKESDTPLQQVSIEEILEVQRVEQQTKQESDKLKMQALKERGLSIPKADTLDEY